MGYETDLTNEQWELIAPYFKHGNWGNRAKYPKQELVNAVLYLNKTGCQWYLLPKDFPPYSTVWSFYRRARLDGTWEKVMDHLVQKTRIKAGRAPEPSYVLVDSQSAKTTYASEKRGIDGGKKG